LGQLTQESQARYRALVEQSVAGIYISEGGYIVYANPRLCEWLGRSTQELRTMPSLELLHEDDRPRLAEIRRRRAKGELTLSYETFRFVRPDGGVVHLHMSARLLELEGRRVLFGVAQDVTAQVLAQRALEAANQRLKGLSASVLAIQEQERRDISRELHDEVGQSLLALNLALHRLKPDVSEAHRPLLSQCVEVTTMVQDQVHEMSLKLHPPHLDQLGLAESRGWRESA
jgi:PAS domain S-box-containing protein